MFTQAAREAEDYKNVADLERHYECYCDWCWGHGYGSCKACEADYDKLLSKVRSLESRGDIELQTLNGDST